MATEQETLLKYQRAVEACQKIADELVGLDNGFVCAFLPNKDQEESIPFLVSNASTNEDLEFVLEGLLEAIKKGRLYDPRLSFRES